MPGVRMRFLPRCRARLMLSTESEGCAMKKVSSRIDAPGVAPPHWIVGYGRPALISGAAAWVMALVMLLLVPRLTGKRA